MRRSTVAILSGVVSAGSLIATPPLANAGAPTCYDQPATVVGTEGDDHLIGTDGPDVIAGLGGDDRIEALGGDDLLCGDSGNDALVGGKGEDSIDGGTGSDDLDYRGEEPVRYIQVSLGRGTARSPGPGDTLEIDRLAPGSIENVFFTCESTGTNQASGDSDDNTLVGSAGPNYLWGGRGKDVLYGGGGPDDLYGEKGSDTIYGDAPAGDDRFPMCGSRRRSDLIDGGPGGDHIFGGPSEDAIAGRGGKDVISGGPLADVCRGGRGENTYSACEERVPLGQDCGQRGTQTDLDLEAKYGRAEHRFKHHGCEVRVDILSMRRGPAHCSWEEARFIDTGVPLGQRLSRYSKYRSYVRDAQGVYDKEAQERFHRNRPTPRGATDTGYSKDGWSLWTSNDISYVYLVGSDRTEWWPLNTAMYGCA